MSLLSLASLGLGRAEEKVDGSLPSTISALRGGEELLEDMVSLVKPKG